MPTTYTRLHASLAHAVDALGIDPEQGTVTVGDETISYDSELHLRRDLSAALYRHWHSGSGRRTEARDVRRDHPFEELLREATPHRTSRTEAVVRSGLLDGPLGRHVLFDVGRVRLRIPEDEGPRPLPGIGTVTALELPAVRPALSPGFFLVNGSVGGPAVAGHVLRLYLHLDESATAPTVWQAVLTHLESRSVAYRAKILAKAAGYPRRDAIVLYLGPDAWSAVDGVVEAVRHLPGLRSDYSVLTAPITGGVSYAWDPRDSRIGWDRMSFGQHRTAAIAAAVAAHVYAGADLHTAVADALIESGAEPLAPYRNGDSPQWRPSTAEEVG
ncbi:T3SS effector HopA1 family protein [Embleya sp. NBC_00888]|uniref:T3SS effector HopA1 family protein n=1 Tax=Embleya sp. NBC_00888 TaxID=2975960 RepID=UPI00386B7DE4|nr:T3SS effector HopA1 family protein [Embleya sp. NBC_00888]